jgi:hypothetical protein
MANSDSYKVTSTSLLAGGRSITSSTFSGFPNSCATAAFIPGIFTSNAKAKN